VLELDMSYYSQAVFPMTNSVIDMLCQKFKRSLDPDDITMLYVDIRNARISWGFSYAHPNMIKVLWLNPQSPDCLVRVPIEGKIVGCNSSGFLTPYPSSIN